MKTIYEIFSKSPFTLLTEHIKRVSECLDLVKPLTDAFIQGDQETVCAIGKSISSKEHDADVIKNNIREHLPKSLFMPVSREDVLKLLHRQDNIADYCEDFGVLLAVRKTTVPPLITEDFTAFVDQVILTARHVVEVIQSLSDLMESSFSGPRAEDILTQIETIGQLEYESDKKKFNMVKKMFEHEADFDPISLVFFMKIFDVISKIADSSENTANAIRLMISK